jgi:hypothetical protein
LIESLAEIIEIDVAADDGDLLDGSVRHQVDEEPDTVGQRAFRRLEPHHVGSHAQEVGIVGKGFHPR